MLKKHKKRFLLIGIPIFLLVIVLFFSVIYVNKLDLIGKASYNTLSAEQKQAYWDCFKTNKCSELLTAKKNKEYRKCSFSCNKQAQTATANIWCEDSDKGDNFLEKGIVKSNIYSSGKEDSCYTFPDSGKTYLFEGRCKDSKYQYIQKNCAELGKDYVCDSGKCVSSAPTFISPVECISPTQLSCCGNNLFESQFESPVSCEQDAFNYFKEMKRPIEYVKGDNMLSVFCISPCPFTKNIVDSYHKAYKGLFDEIVSFLNQYPPIYAETIPPLPKGDSKKYPSFSVVLGDINANYNMKNQITYFLPGSLATQNFVRMGCPTGLCIAGNNIYTYLNDEEKIFKQLNSKSDVIQEFQFARSETHETLHAFLPPDYCPDWNHGFVMFLDNMISSNALIYDEYFSFIDKMYLQGITIGKLSEEDIIFIKEIVGPDYDRFVGYVFWGGLYKYHGCDKQCVKDITQEWLSQINKEQITCSGKEFVSLINKHLGIDVTIWAKSLGLYGSEDLNEFKQKIMN